MQVKIKIKVFKIAFTSQAHARDNDRNIVGNVLVASRNQNLARNCYS